jgi:hypothetical protein
LSVLCPTALYDGVDTVVSNVNGGVSLVKMTGLLLCLLELRRPAD